MARTIADGIAALEALSSPELRARWEQAFGRTAPKRTSRDLLLRALAYRLQEQIEGGLSKAALRRLARLACADGNGTRPPKVPLRGLKPGTRLVREWRGEVHHVTVLENGFDYRGKHYASLSRIARDITGTRWSGPLFFGLRKAGAQPKEDGHGR